MSLGTITKSDGTGQNPSTPVFADRISFAGDSSYPTGGTATFKTLLRAVTKDARTPIAVIGQDCGGYVAVYDEANDKLKVYKCAGSAAPMVEVSNAADLSAVTFNLVVLSY